MWATTAAVTLPSRCPTRPLRRWEPSTIRLAPRSSATSTIPFQVGAASIVDALRPESRLLCQRCAVLGGLLGGLPHLVGRRGVEVLFAGRHEADVARLPDADDQRVATGRELAAGLLDRELRELGAVVGEQHRPRGGRGRGVAGG